MLSSLQIHRSGMGFASASCRGWTRVKLAAVVPFSIGRRIVRVEVAQTIGRTVVQAAAPPHTAHDIRVDEVGDKRAHPVPL